MSIDIENTELEVKVKYFEGQEEIEKIPIGDWIDLRANEDVELKAGESAYIHLGVAMQLPKGFEGHVAPRSSTFKRWGIIQTNSIGIIDESYCGDEDEWCMPVLAVRDTIIHKGDRVCQFRIIEKQPGIKFVTVEKLGNDNRGGLGSTGGR